MFHKKQQAPSDAHHVLDAHYYQHKTVLITMSAPLRALESDAAKFEDGLKAAQLSVFLLEKFAWANGSLKDKEPSLDEFLEKEKQKIKEEGVEDLNSERVKTRLAYSKMAWIYREIKKTLPSSTEYEV